MGTIRVLVVEDEMIIAWDLRRMLEDLGCEVLPIASSAEKAVDAARSSSPDLILMDVILKGTATGIDAALEIRRFSWTPIVYLTGNTHLLSEDLLRETDSQGLYSKPPSPRLLGEILDLARRAAGELNGAGGA
jgi:CheY-like chemotaxis protein